MGYQQQMESTETQLRSLSQDTVSRLQSQAESTVARLQSQAESMVARFQMRTENTEERLQLELQIENLEARSQSETENQQSPPPAPKKKKNKTKNNGLMTAAEATVVAPGLAVGPDGLFRFIDIPDVPVRVVGAANAVASRAQAIELIVNPPPLSRQIQQAVELINPPLSSPRGREENESTVSCITCNTTFYLPCVFVICGPLLWYCYSYFRQFF